MDHDTGLCSQSGWSPNPWVRNGGKTVLGVLTFSWGLPKAKFSVALCLMVVSYPFKLSPYTLPLETHVAKAGVNWLLSHSAEALPGAQPK